MSTSSLHRSSTLLRVLVVGRPGAGRTALVEWLAEIEGLVIAVPDELTIEGLKAARQSNPDVVVLDFHGVPVSTAYLVLLFKGTRDRPNVFVLTHDASPVMRRRCRQARVDAVFDKTNDLDLLHYTLRLKFKTGAVAMAAMAR